MLTRENLRSLTPTQAVDNSENTMDAEKGPQDVATQGVLSSDASQISVPVEPYSIYSRNEKWFIVAVVALAGVAVISLLVFANTDAGRMIFDTKLGVDIDAAGFLARLWSVWNPLEWFGTLQNQYIGYAIPMAPFFLLGQLAHVPIWLIERLWLERSFHIVALDVERALVVDSDDGQLTVQAGQAVHAWPGEWVRYSSPGTDGAEYISVCVPAFDPGTVHRDD